MILRRGLPTAMWTIEEPENRGLFTSDVVVETCGTPVSKAAIRKPVAESRTYQLLFAESAEDLENVFRLRFVVFNLELGEGLESAYKNGRDTDRFDAICDHLIVEHRKTGAVVGTYRLQTGRVAATNLGYYSEREFDFSPYEPIRNSLTELAGLAFTRDIVRLKSLPCSGAESRVMRLPVMRDT